ncbi:MAG: threonylcarbamoyl-AMP synthase [Phycisphaerales bacterium]|nr:threonylcarbamoyl-AMP synthase [Phycisphaerales bacterium]
MSRIVSGPEAIAEGVERLGAGKPVAFPTETVYGLGADAFNSHAVGAVFTLKGRPSTNPLIVHVSGTKMARRVVETWSEQADAIARAHWPGPITIVLNKHQSIPGIVCAGGKTVAVRCPSHPIALALIDAFDKPIVGPSANPSGRISPTCPVHVAGGFPDTDLIIIDGGACHAGIESTVVDLTNSTPRILRRGLLGREALANTLGGVEVEIADHTPTNEPARSPGVIGAHYQPRTPCQLVNSEQTAGCIDTQIALIAWSIPEHRGGGHLFGLDEHAGAYAAGLYHAMHRADACSASMIWIETPPIDAANTPADRAIFEAVLERLARATQSG